MVLQADPTPAVELARGPYLQLVTTTSATVVWRTDADAACSLAIAPSGSEPRVIDGGRGTTCAIAASDLTPGAAYDYLPQADGIPLGAASTFRTDSSSGAFVFAVIGDHGDNIATSQAAVRDRLLETDPDFILSTGDMIYPDGAAEDFDPKFFVPYAALLRQIVFWPCLGNHDVQADRGDSWRAPFYTPANNPSGSEDYYSFEWGNAHVLVIDSNQSTSPGSKQYAFIEQDLGASTARWKIAAFHHTIYSNGGSGGDERIAAHLVPLFDRDLVDVVFMGHDHDYERTLPLYDDEVVDPGDGSVYITTGGGGADLHAVGHSRFTAYSEKAFHIVRVTVDGDTLGAEMIRADGVVRDTVSLAKACGPSGCCQRQADCDDQQSCTLDTCRVSGRCRHAAIDVDDVRMAVAQVQEVGCAGETIPSRVTLPMQQAQTLMARAVRAGPGGRRARLVRMAARKLQRAGRRTERAATRGRITPDCARAIASAIAAARFECID